jgi:hypothetical protein
MRQHLPREAALARDLAREPDAVLGMDEGEADLGGQRADRAGLEALAAYRDLAPPLDAGDGEAEVVKVRMPLRHAGLGAELRGRQRLEDARLRVLQDDAGRGRAARRAGRRFLRQGRGGEEEQAGQRRPHSQPLRLK